MRTCHPLTQKTMVSVPINIGVSEFCHWLPTEVDLTFQDSLVREGIGVLVLAAYPFFTEQYIMCIHKKATQITNMTVTMVTIKS